MPRSRPNADTVSISGTKTAPWAGQSRPKRRAKAETKSEVLAESNEQLPEAKLSIELGPYVVHDILDNDKTGNLFRAHHSESNYPVAIKVLPPLKSQRGTASAWSHDRMDRFSQEVETATRVIHDNIARPTFIGEQNDVQYVAMEYVDGISLQKILDRDGQLEVSVACEIILQAASGLRHIHEKKLVHRDIRPANIVLSRQGAIKIMELGVGQLKVTDDQECLGDEAYLAPELLERGHADIRSDIYALGCTAYRLLCGEIPEKRPEFGNKVRPLIRQKPDLSPKLAAVVDRMMADDPDARYPTPHDVVIEMCTWAQEEKLADLVAWHMNTQNAGLAPVVVFQGVERRRKQDEQARRRLENVGKKTRTKLGGRQMRDPKPDLTATINENPQYAGLVTILSIVGAAIGICAFLGGRASVAQSTFQAASSPTKIVNALQRPNSGEHQGYHDALRLGLNEAFGLPEGKWVLPPHENEPLYNANLYGATKEHFAVVKQPFTQAVQLNVPNQGDAAWDAGYYFSDVGGIRRGDRLLLIFWMRARPNPSSKDSITGRLAVFVEDSTNDEKDLYVDIEPNDQWQQYLIPFESKCHALRRIGMHLGLQEQQIQFGGIALLNYEQEVPLTSLPTSLGD